LSTTNPTWTDPRSNPSLHGERTATNRLSHGTAYSGLRFNEPERDCTDFPPPVLPQRYALPYI
jgi:hypothetical protein